MNGSEVEGANLPASKQHVADSSTKISNKNIFSSGGGNTINGVVIEYKECLKNHAAALGSTATDGCGEFMPSGEGGSLCCSACGCHRNFHRKEVGDGGGCGSGSSPQPPFLPQCPYWGGGSSSKGVLRARRGPQYLAIERPVGPTLPLGSVKLEENGGEGDRKRVVEEGQERVEMVIKKRYRTKFTKEQKEKMMGFAEKAGWKIQKLDEGLVQHFCQVVGIKRKVLKVWMHNNKHHFVNKHIHNHSPTYDNTRNNFSGI